MAHNLINKFGSISGVIDADYIELKSIAGIGEETALFLNVLQDFIEVYKQSKSKTKEVKLSSIMDIVDYFRSTQEIKEREYLYIYGLSKRNTLVKKYEIIGEDDCEVNLDFKDVISKIFVGNVSGVFLVHTHPHGSVLPSMVDIETTNRFKKICEILGLVLHDHIIINKTDYFSFRQNGMFNEGKSKQYSPEDFGNTYISDKKRGKK